MASSAEQAGRKRRTLAEDRGPLKTRERPTLVDVWPCCRQTRMGQPDTLSPFVHTPLGSPSDDAGNTAVYKVSPVFSSYARSFLSRAATNTRPEDVTIGPLLDPKVPVFLAPWAVASLSSPNGIRHLIVPALRS
jgi:hypothetical protein